MAGRLEPRGPKPQTFLDWFPVVMRYTGVGIAVFAAIRYEADRPSLYLLALGMMTGEYVANWAFSRTKSNGGGPG